MQRRQPASRLTLAVFLGMGGAWLVLAVGNSAAAAGAGDRPSEDALFGGAAGSGGSAGAASEPSASEGTGGAPAREMLRSPSLSPPPPPPLPSPPPPPSPSTSWPAVNPSPAPAAVSVAVPARPATGAAPEPLAAPVRSPMPAASANAASARDEALLGASDGGPKLSQDVAPDDPLKIGGQIYLRAQTSAGQGNDLRDAAFSAPSLVDGYFDARPNERVRGFVLGRLFFDPTLPTSPAPAVSTNASISGALRSATVPQVSGQQQQVRGPSAALDQLWLRFDLARTVFVTVGRQHVKWGTGRFWTPTDFLHPQARNPIAAFDARTGFTMLKLHLPIERLGWNLYAFGLAEGPPAFDATGRSITGGDTASHLRQLGGALRAELVLGTAELGLDLVTYGNRRPKAGADLSFGIGDFDLYADAGFRAGSEIVLRKYTPEGKPPSGTIPTSADAQQAYVNQWVDNLYAPAPASGIKPQIALGGTYSLKYNDNDVFTITGEYFYNSIGYDDPRIYPGLFLSGTFQFFYTGRHYGSLSFIAAAPYDWNYSTFSLTTLANFSDQSLISRLNYSLVLLTHLTFEAFVAANYGRQSGEFRLGVQDILVPTASGLTPFSQAPQLFSAGIGFRIAI